MSRCACQRRALVLLGTGPEAFVIDTVEAHRAVHVGIALARPRRAHAVPADVGVVATIKPGARAIHTEAVIADLPGVTLQTVAISREARAAHADLTGRAIAISGVRLRVGSVGRNVWRVLRVVRVHLVVIRVGREVEPAEIFRAERSRRGWIGTAADRAAERQRE